MQCKIRRESRSRGLDTAFRYAPDLLGRRSLPYLNSIASNTLNWVIRWKIVRILIVRQHREEVMCMIA